MSDDSNFKMLMGLHDVGMDKSQPEHTQLAARFMKEVLPGAMSFIQQEMARGTLDALILIGMVRGCGVMLASRTLFALQKMAPGPLRDAIQAKMIDSVIAGLDEEIRGFFEKEKGERRAEGDGGGSAPH